MQGCLVSLESSSSGLETGRLDCRRRGDRRIQSEEDSTRVGGEASGCVFDGHEVETSNFRPVGLVENGVPYGIGGVDDQSESLGHPIRGEGVVAIDSDQEGHKSEEQDGEHFGMAKGRWLKGKRGDGLRLLLVSAGITDSRPLARLFIIIQSIKPAQLSN